MARVDAMPTVDHRVRRRELSATTIRGTSTDGRRYIGDHRDHAFDEPEETAFVADRRGETRPRRYRQSALHEASVVVRRKEARSASVLLELTKSFAISAVDDRRARCRQARMPLGGIFSVRQGLSSGRAQSGRLLLLLSRQTANEPLLFKGERFPQDRYRASLAPIRRLPGNAHDQHRPPGGLYRHQGGRGAAALRHGAA